jgi:hypothetical protein
MPVVNIAQEAADKFLPSIIFRFSVPRWVLIDNSTQFKGTKFTWCCADFDINHQESLSHPILRPKMDAHRMCVQDQDFTHTARITAFQIKPVS